MEKKHKSRLKATFPRALQHKSLTMLDIPDDYHYMDIELIELLQQSLQDYL
ncbi:phosphotyrosine protein phosphatase [Kingella kingae]|uniref:phosphotyrosine protein phosphatase n=1 Tax=Kingella kingae TaxID=504 RepID=UPI0019D2161F|nr:phosphotyrosine protein phosphatase [Kingella kingae]MDK4529277.1 phosphotyrosine protein phosphatase [Kingella kingae]MDK4579858.1 phosphotyrosine protein phosphatase [Kingella kingae]MDK4584147.1 phosphotyrosine protein phosphatase [Kingella kingae]MDK4585753.1 phosphotyrosine protein phosphatase [Kingella kingae]MDK4588142.1 phosphotyrosine protein phosphatase [Kingella kingae]